MAKGDVTVKLATTVKYNGEWFSPGQEITLPRKDAQHLVKSGAVEGEPGESNNPVIRSDDRPDGNTPGKTGSE